MFERTILKDVIEYCLEEIEHKKNQKSALLCLGLVVYLVCDVEQIYVKDKAGKSKMENYLNEKIIPRLKSVLQEAFNQSARNNPSKVFHKNLLLLSELSQRTF